MVTQVLAGLDKVDYAGVVRNVNGLVDDVRHDLSNGGDVHAAVAQAQKSIADVQARIDEADLPALSAQLRRTGDAFALLAQGPPTRDLVAQTRAAVARLPKLIDNLTQVANHADAGVSDAEAELIPILRDVRAAVANLRETTEAIPA